MPSRIFSFFFVILWFLPPVFAYFRFDSYTLSTVGIVLLFNIVYYLYEKKVFITRKFFSILTLSLSFILIHSFLAAVFFFKGYNLGRNLSSILMLMILLVGAFNFSNVLPQLPKDFLTRMITRIFYVYIFLIILSLIVNVAPTRYAKPIFPYSEPSHLALFFGPVIAYLIIVSKSRMKRLLLIFTGVLVALVIKNMTLLVTMIIISVFVYNIYVIPILILSSVGLFFFSDLDYFSERVDFTNMHKTNNLSTLVYVKGFQLIDEGLKVTKGWGIGFQQLGHVPLRTDIGDYMKAKMNGLELNSQDGGFTAAKVIAELGIVGVLLSVMFIYYLLKQWNRYRKISKTVISSHEALFFASIITVFSEFFFRGIGYFSASIFLFMAVLMLRKSDSEMHISKEL
ncbi:hypothetical protein ASG31_03905 [Chryseobacterium sp. Leaf404]|uniref:hypothetical protein n=1 Tax=unclassified Chryseobacterium TaxID=2593645 RepID=UPI000701403A|nr:MULTISPECIES: hypothetical protein [unclassified Chryseobacterium]KQT17891.1 hypothetical protein ASG31_03905 [Chryseobacterium sp. Leaf404]